ncbi:MAG: hypothetical protein LPJ98_12225, partial [Cyclobacteriaceae bacterium]|nr:hypothetical protein [Cyclobacteriaceae bacterium]
MRINLFDQIKAFYTWVFANQDKAIKPHHHSLYFFLLNQNNRTNWIEWFKCPFDLGMMGSGINSKHTYYKVLKELADWGLIQYQPGINNFKAPLIKIEVQKCTATSTATGPQPAPLLGTNKDNRHLDKRQETKTEFTPEILEDEHFDEPKDEKLNERIFKATKKIAEFFSISELRQPKHYMTIGNFVRYHANKGDLDFLADQFTAYKEI